MEKDDTKPELLLLLLLCSASLEQQRKAERAFAVLRMQITIVVQGDGLSWGCYCSSQNSLKKEKSPA